MNEKTQLNCRQRRKRLLLLALAVLVLVLLGVAAFSRHAPLSRPERQVQVWLDAPTQVDSSGGLVGSNRFADFGTDTIPYLVAVLTNQSSHTEQFGLDVTKQLGPKLYWRMPLFLRRFLTPRRSVENDRSSAEVALTYVPHKSAVLVAVVPLLKDSRAYVRAPAARIFRDRTTRGDTNWLPALVGGLNRETNAVVQVELAWAIGQIDTNQTAALSLLRGKTNDPDRFVRSLAIRGLGDITAGRGQSE